MVKSVACGYSFLISPFFFRWSLILEQHQNLQLLQHNKVSTYILVSKLHIGMYVKDIIAKMASAGTFSQKPFGFRQNYRYMAQYTLSHAALNLLDKWTDITSKYDESKRKQMLLIYTAFHRKNIHMLTTCNGWYFLTNGYIHICQIPLNISRRQNIPAIRTLNKHYM